MVYLILAIIGSFTLSLSQAFSYEKKNRDILESGGYFSSIALTIDWLAEDTLTISKAHRNSNSLFRICLLRVFTLTGIAGIAMFLAKSNLKINKNDNITIINNLIPLKLRI